MLVNNNNFTDALRQLKAVTSENKSVVIDVETNGLDYYGLNQLCGIGIGEPKHNGLLQY